ncbi:hypothetical protein [Halorubrum halodurans]|uniref:hypothetical protein n=1 Tax=Halorubrum halodurans TaxID=1383851 RepID=UPI001179AB20|nr:hypothetical protein [Halorubrum halodurans]
MTAHEEIAANDDAVSVENAEAEYGLLRVTSLATTFVSGIQGGDIDDPAPRVLRSVPPAAIVGAARRSQESNTTDA